MKVLVVFSVLSFSLAACGPQSSPEGRTTSKIERVQQSIDSIKVQNKGIADSLYQMRKEISELKSK